MKMLFIFLLFCASLAVAEIEIQDSAIIFPSSNSTDRNLVVTSNRRSVLILRAYASSKGPTATASDLKKYIFTDPNSLKEQMYKCSAGAIDLYQSSYGVIDVYMNDRITNNINVDSFVSSVSEKALDYVSSSYTDIRQVADHVVIVLPNIFDDFVAWAEIRSPGSTGAISYYQDTYALSLTVLQHEFAHNLGLFHAYWRGDEYGDYTGNMGRSLKTKEGPLMCYNAANHWQLNWFQERRLDLGNYGPSTQRSITLSAFVDFTETSTGQYVLVRVGKLYMQYNRAKKHNVGTRAMPNKLVIIRENGTSTTLLTALDVSTPLYKEGDIEIRVCSVKTVRNVDTMEIVIRNGSTSCPKATSSDGSSWGQAPAWNTKTGIGTKSNYFFTWNRDVDFPAVSVKVDNKKNTGNNKKTNTVGTGTSWSLRGTGFRCVTGC